MKHLRPFCPGRSVSLALVLALGLTALPGLVIAGPRPAPDDDRELPAAATEKVSFAKHIRPILEENCFRCHGERRQRSEYRLDSREAAIKGGEIGQAIVVGKSAKSSLIRYVAGLEEDMEMPPSGDPLTPEQIGLLRAWIDQGLEWSEAETKVEVVEVKLEKATLKAQSDRITSVAIAAGGGRLASAGGQSLPFRPGVVTLWDLESGKKVSDLPAAGSLVWSVAFSPDGTRIAAGTYDKQILVYDARSGEVVATLEGHGNWVTSVAFSPDGKVLASGSEDSTVRLWDPVEGKELAKLEGHKATVRSLAFSPDGKTLATGSQDGTIKLWDVEKRAEVASLEGHEDGVFSIDFSPDGRLLASSSADRTIRIWSLEDSREIRKLQGHTNWVVSVAFSPAGNVVASGGYDRLIKLWDPADGKELKTFPGHESAVWGLAFTPDGRVLASGSQDGTVKLWDVPAATPAKEAKVMRF